MPCKGSLTCLFILIFSLLRGQTHSRPNDSVGRAYPQNYFRNPLGIPMELTANFGELRSDHWHMGLDLRTNQKVNQPVYAAASGFISHVGIRPLSFGRYIIIDHPNGLSTLYAHLNDFFPGLEKYVTEQQYLQESWAIEIDLEKNLFPVKKGQFIAYSGNTGGSQGPHLHFEIRDTKTDKCLNPLLFGFPVEDDVPPTLTMLALYDGSRSIYDQSPQLYNLKKTDSGYIIPKAEVLRTGFSKLNFAVQAHDRVRGSTNPNGIYAAELFFDDQFISGFRIDSITYKESLYIKAHTDFRHRYNGGSALQLLWKLPGDRGSVYQNETGFISLDDTVMHHIKIAVRDAAGNESVINFMVQLDSLVKVHANTGQLVPGNVNVIEKPEFEVYFPETSLYDSVQPYYYRKEIMPVQAVSAAHQLNDSSIPLHDEISLRIKLTQTIPDDWKEKLLIKRTSGQSIVRKATWQNTGGESWATAKFNDLGNYQVFVDLIPPVVNDPGKKGKGDTINLSPSKSIVFHPTDNFGVIKNFRAELNGEWERFTNDKGRSWIYNFDESFPFGIHHLKVRVEDLAGNVTVKEWWFRKYPYTPPEKKVVKKKKRK